MTYTIYLVMDGDWESYGVRKIFRDFSKAQEHISENAKLKRPERYIDPSIEEWTIV